MNCRGAASPVAFIGLLASAAVLMLADSILDRFSLTDLIGMVLSVIMAAQLKFTIDLREMVASKLGTNPKTVDERISEAMSKVASQLQTTVSTLQNHQAEELGELKRHHSENLERIWEHQGRLQERLDGLGRKRRARE